MARADTRPVRILVVDDDRVLRDALRRALTLGGYDVRLADGGYEGLAQVAESRPDAIVLDVLMPDFDGTPVLMLTARDAVDDRIAGLDAGADDYLVKPFDVEELKARLRALLRRGGDDLGNGKLTFRELTLDPDRHGVRSGAELVELTRTEYQLLELLMLNPRRVLPHSLIYERVWGYDFGPSSNALRVYIGYLRRKLAELDATDVIHNVRGVGYVLREA
jgi:two-component system response regulator MprA